MARASVWHVVALLLVAPFALAAPAVPGLTAATPVLAARAPSKLQPRAPQASKRMGQRRRRAVTEPKKKKDYSAFLCPGGSVACPVGEPVSAAQGEALEATLNSLGDWFKVGFECIELDTELNQCGGCLALGKGQDCSIIPNTRATACEKGGCVVISCKDGYTLSSDRKQCLRSTSTGGGAQQPLRR